MIPIWIDFGALPIFEFLPVLLMGLVAFFMQTIGYSG